MGGHGRLLKCPARYYGVSDDHLGCNQRDEGDSLMGVDCAISRIWKMELLVSHMGIKSRIVSDTHTVSVHNSSLHRFFL